MWKTSSKVTLDKEWTRPGKLSSALPRAFLISTFSSYRLVDSLSSNIHMQIKMLLQQLKQNEIFKTTDGEIGASLPRLSIIHGKYAKNKMVVF